MCRNQHIADMLPNKGNMRAEPTTRKQDVLPPPKPKTNAIKTVRCTCGHRLFDYEGAIHNLQIKCPKCKKVNFVNR